MPPGSSASGQPRARGLPAGSGSMPSYGFRRRAHPCPGCSLHPAGLFFFCRFCLLPESRWAICPCAPYAAPGRNLRWGRRPCGARRTGDSCCSCSGAALFCIHGARSGARSLTCRPGCPGGTGTGMTRERPGKSGFSGREQKKHCLLLRLGIWTFDCVREVAAWGR